MPNLRPDWHLSHARGYLLLGMADEAASELAALPPEWLEREDVLALRAGVLQEQREWVLLQPLAQELARRSPGSAEWWIMWAYATRRAESLSAANTILRDAETHHPDEATIQFNLGCYACQLGDLEEARKRVARACALDNHFVAASAEDPDLAPLRDTGWRP